MFYSEEDEKPLEGFQQWGARIHFKKIIELDREQALGRVGGGGQEQKQ